MMSATQRVLREWGYEVEAEMRRLIERGVPPFDAAETARRNVSARRQRIAHKAAIEEDNDPEYQPIDAAGHPVKS